MMKKITIYLVVIAIFSALTAGSARANDEDMKIILKDSLYGGLLGFIIGGAVLLFDVDNVKILGYGTGAGIIAGTIYGITTTTTSLFEYEEGKLFIGAPSLKTKIKKYTGKKGVSVAAEIFRYRF